MGMIGNPSFRSCFHVEIVKPNRVFLFDEKGTCHLLEGAGYVLLAPYLRKQTYSTDQIVKRLERKLSEAEVYFILMRLEEKGFIEEVNLRLSRPLAAFCHLLDVKTQDALRRLNETAVSLTSVNQISTKVLEKMLKKLLIKVVPEGVLQIVFTDNYRHEKLFEINREALKTGRPWLLVRPVGAELWVGPLFVPQQTGCFHCLHECLRQNQLEEVFIESTNKKRVTIHRATLPTASPVAHGLVANEVFKWVVQGFNKELEGKVLSYNSISSSLESHRLVRRVHCEACGTPPVQNSVPFQLESQKKQFVEDGGHRTVSPEETYKKHQHLISPITGIVGFVKRAQETHSSMHAYIAGHNIGDLNYRDRPSLEGLRTASGGKGKSEAQAKASCLCEAIERYSGIFRGDEIRKRGSYSQLKAEAIHPESFLLFSKNQYRSREQFNCESQAFHWIPQPFDEEKVIDWTPVWSFREKRFKWFPTAASYFSYPFATPEDKFCGGDSNGCAAGNTKEEAILQGFFELVERDGVALWWYSRMQRPGVDLDSFKDPYISQLIAYYGTQGREVWAIDLTMDLNIPAFATLSRFLGREKEEIIFGFGAHFDPKIALLRALTEMNQFLNHSHENLERPRDKIARTWRNTATIQGHPYLIPSQAPSKKYQDYVRFDTLDLKEDILNCQKIVEEKGMEMLVLDQTRPDIGLPVVRVIVPGLRHFWNRFAPGRLYDIPFKMGYVSKKLQEEELNPIPIFL